MTSIEKEFRQGHVPVIHLTCYLDFVITKTAVLPILSHYGPPLSTPFVYLYRESEKGQMT